MKIVAIPIIALLVFAGSASAQSPYGSLQVPKQIQYQGRVATGTGGAWAGTAGYFVFALVQGATVLWNNWQGTASPADPGTVSLGSGQVLTLPVNSGVFSIRLGDGSGTNQQIPATVFFDSTGNAVRTGVKLAVWFSPDDITFTRLSPDVEFTAVPFAMVAGIAETVQDRSITALKIKDGEVGSTQLANGLTLGGTTTGTFSGTFSGSGAGLSGVTAASLAIPPGMALIPAGSFTMGNVVGDADITDAAPVGTTVSAFYMDVNEVTLSQWQSVCYWATSHGYIFVNNGAGKAANHPVQSVNWYDCVKWCNARSQQAGLTPVYYTDDAQTMIYKTGEVNVTNARVKWSANGYRLPTEAEWEKAARGGLSGQRFPWGNTITQYLANYYGNTPSTSYDLGPNGYNTIGSIGGTSPATSPVGSFAANGYGLDDMGGNVWEMCWDCYGVPYAGGADPHGPAGLDRVVRGGNWNYGASYCRVALRISRNQSYCDNSIGFRLARSADP